MKHSVKHIRFERDFMGRFTSIVIVRGMELRSYQFTPMRGMIISKAAAKLARWEESYQKDYTALNRVYPK